MRFIIVAIAILTCTAAGSASAQTARDSADAAWSSGNTADALRLYAAIFAADTTDVLPLHRMALIHAWAERFDESTAMLDRLLRMQPDNVEARLDRARVVAWSGDAKGAVMTIDSILAANPANVTALQVRAQFLSWAGNYDEALRGYDRALEIAPDNRATHVDRARVLSWARDFTKARAAYSALLERDPGDREVLLGLGNMLSLVGDHDSARVVLRKLLAVNPQDVDALRGIARAATWEGDLREGERLWREALVATPADADVLVGYAQVLRWQGRDALAREQLLRARAISPGNADVIEQMRWVDLAMAPRANPSFTYEADSDGNNIGSTAVSAAFRVMPRIEVRGDAFRRQASVDNVTGSTTVAGALIGGWMQLEPGWAFQLSAGASASDIDGAETNPSFRAAITTPGRYPLGATVAYTQNTLDGTAPLIASRVRLKELTGDVYRTVATVRLNASAGFATFDGHASDRTNERWQVNAAATRPASRRITLGLRARAFGFSEDLNDAYFDPDFYGLGEATARYLREGTHWVMNLEAAPGIQQVRRSGDPSVSFRTAGRVGYVVRPGRTIALNLTYAKSGMQQLSPVADGDYSYRAVGLTAGWTF